MSIIEKIGDIKRFDQIINVLFKYEMGFFVEKLRLKDRLSLHQRLQKEKFKQRVTQPETLRKIFEELGGAFIKFAQFLSVRPDLIPKEYVKEFEKLQDKVHPMPKEVVKNIIEKEFKKPLKEVFKEFDEEPVASASIAQVHKASLRTGESVALKVQRPNISEIMERDIDLMFAFADHMEKHNHDIKGVDPRLVVNEFKKWTEKEMDFEKEADNIEIFRKNFEKKKNVVIPKVYRDYSTKKVLTMEFIEGIKLNDIEKINEKGYDIDKIIKNCFNCVMKQVFEDGFFHADPHPGNILVLNNDKLSFIDFGIVGSFDEGMKDNVTNLLVGVVKNDIDMVMSTFINMGLDEENIKSIKTKIEEKIKVLQDSEFKDIVISKVLEDILDLLQKQGFKLPLDFVLFGKTIMTLEGLALKYDEEFRLTVQSKAFVEKIIKKRRSPKEIAKRLVDVTIKMKDFSSKIPEKTSILLKRMKEADINLRYIDRDLRGLIIEMDRGTNRVTFGLITAALIIASTFMLNYNQVKIMNIPAFSFIGFIISGLLIIVLVFSVLKKKQY